MDTILSKNNIPIRLTYKQWAHIVEAHDYMAGCLDLITETLSFPDYIVNGWSDEQIAIKHYPKTVITEKHVIVIFKENIKRNDGFVITAFMTSKVNKILKRGIIWKKIS